MRNKIDDVLQTYLNDAEVPMEKVFYGVCTEDLDKWNYFVFKRVNSSEEENASLNEYYDIHIIHEDYIPDGYEYEIIKSIREATGMRPIRSNAIEFNYRRKSNTNMAVEICTIHMTRGRKASVMR